MTFSSNPARVELRAEPDHVCTYYHRHKLMKFLRLLQVKY